MKPPPWVIAGALVVFCTAQLRAAGTAEVPPDPLVPSPHVRAVTPAAQILLTDAVTRSAVVNDLIGRLMHSDTFVYVELTASPMIPIARTTLVTAAAGVRFVRVAVHIQVPPRQRVPYLAHELQHAVEIAEAPEVRDDAGFGRHFARVGFANVVGHYETQAARDVERRVRLETARAAK